MKERIVQTARIFLFFSFLCGSAAAQDVEPPGGKYNKPFDWLTQGIFRPYIELGYGGGIAEHKLMEGTAPTYGVGELRFGYREMKPFKSWGYKLDDRYAFGAYGATDLPLGKVGSGQGGNFWRAGVARKEGFGYEIAFMKVILHHGYSVNLTGLKTDSYAGLSPADSSIIARYNNLTSLVIGTEPGVTAVMFGFLSVSAGVDVSVISPRIVFPEWIGSYLLAAASVGVVSNFAEDIVNVSPVLGPVLYFVLRNGVALAWAFAWRSDMNWPFPSETPMMLSTARLNIGIQF